MIAFRGGHFDRRVGRHRPLRRIFQRQLTIVIMVLPLCACGSAGGLTKVDADPSLVTGGIQQAALVDSAQNSDANTIRNAISAANLDMSGGVPLLWANRDTGSRGTVNQINETEDDGVVCRKFETSRESFEGVALYKGNVCLGADGQWFMQDFAAL
jgi:surface antigen